jgi:hypothetical protein
MTEASKPPILISVRYTLSVQQIVLSSAADELRRLVERKAVDANGRLALIGVGRDLGHLAERIQAVADTVPLHAEVET